MIRKSKSALLLGVTLFAVTFGLYFQTRNFEFINYDDREYIHNNGVVTNGLGIASIKWAFGPEQCRQMSNWHPVTTLSWMLDVSLFGVNSGAMHLHNAFVHSVNGVLLFLFLLMLLRCMEGGTVAPPSAGIEADAPSGSAQHVGCLEKKTLLTIDHLPLTAILAAFIGAAFWAWHPLRAESVAWVSSRKDVLSILFLLPGLMAYLKALRGGGKSWLFISGLCYLFAYFSKPTAVVYPLLAVMLEYVVTRRISWRQNELLVYLMGVLMAVTFMVQDVGGATVSVLNLVIRLENAVAGLGQYVITTLWPCNLCIFYNYEIPVPLFRFLLGAVFLLAVVWFLLDWVVPCIKRYWEERYEPMPEGGYPVEPRMMVAFGILWFGVALAPVIGLIQVGFASCADRYTYLSGLGLSIVISVAVWELQGYVKRLKSNRARLLTAILYPCLVVSLVVVVMLSYLNMGHWRNTKTVFHQAIRSTNANYVAYCNAGICMLEEKHYEEALDCFLSGAKYFFADVERKGIVTPFRPVIQSNLSVIFSVLTGCALEQTEKGLMVKGDVMFSTKVKSDDPLAAKKIFTQGLCAYWRELDNLAVQYFDEAIQITPLDDYLWRFKGYSLERMGLQDEALAAFKRSLSLKPEKDIQKRVKELEQAIAAGKAGTVETGDQGDIRHGK